VDQSPSMNIHFQGIDFRAVSERTIQELFAELAKAGEEYKE